MIFVSLTRLRLRSVRFLPGFAVHAVRSNSQLRTAPGFLGGGLLPDRRFTFWTLSSWENEASMRAYMISGAHRAAMPTLMRWCDEASVAHWEQESTTLPGWTEAAERMRREGRTSKLLHPGPHHADLSFDAPRVTFATSVTPAVRP